MTYYAEFLAWVALQNPSQLKFLDECHFQAKGTPLLQMEPTQPHHFLTFLLMFFSDYKPRKALAPRGRPAILLRPGSIPDPCSITLVTSLDTDSLCYWTLRHGSNTQHDFVDTIERMILDGVLRAGNILIMDNATVHIGEASFDRLCTLLLEAQVTRVLLPTYSPELNPCEFVFARIKNFIRSPSSLLIDPVSHRLVSRQLNDLLDEAVGLISHESMVETYRHCRMLQPNSDVMTHLVNRDLINIRYV